MKILASVMKVTILACVAVGGRALGDTPRVMFDYIAVHGGGWNMNVPRRPLTAPDIERWSRILNASESQVQFMNIMYERFVERHNEFMDREAPEYLRLARELGEAASQSMSDRNVLRHVRTVDAASARIVRQLTAIEHEFIAGLEPILTDEQRERLDVLRHEASRRNCRVHTSYSRWGKIELRAVWAEPIDALATPAEREAVGRILAEYEAALTRLVCESADAVFRARQRLVEHRISHSERPVTREQGRARVARIMKDLVNRADEIRALHERTIERIAQVLSEEVAVLFVRSAKEAAFPEVYPDPFAAHALFEAVVENEELVAETRRAVVDLHSVYALHYARECRELEEFCVEYGDRITRQESGFSPHLLPAALEPRLRQRDELSDEYVAELEEIIGSEAIARLGVRRIARSERPELIGWFQEIEAIEARDAARAREAAPNAVHDE